MRRLAILVFAAIAAAAIGCGSGDADTEASADVVRVTDSSRLAKSETKDSPSSREDEAAGAVDSRSQTGKTIKVVDSDYGPVIADGRGEAFYLFDKERGKQSRCYGECARVWPPVLTKGPPRAGAGADPQLLGTTKRKNGKLQVTYKGHPLYYYVDDAPGTILCQDVNEFGGLWLVVQPSGDPVT